MTGTGRQLRRISEYIWIQVIPIPTNRPKQGSADNLYVSLARKVYASLECIKTYHALDDPLLILLVCWDVSRTLFEFAPQRRNRS